jgi:chromosome segregation ATPase
MFLSQLKVTGFKSYAETVVVEFSPKIAVIIGSNGVGKSNALEGIVWALGEQDPWVLRCVTPEDLLFAGSKHNPSADEATVELTFDDNGSEFNVIRSMKRSGEQGFHVRDKELENIEDYRNALAAEGLGDGLNHVIRQEELTDFFTRTPADRRRFLEQYTSSNGDLKEINRQFDSFIGELIPGSTARVVPLDGSDGMDVEVNFPDKGVKRGVLLSGGERAVTALALKLALFEMRPGPMYLLDEVEPALDWSRNRSTQELLKTLSAKRQLIMITHFQSTIHMAETVHGVRVRPDGSSWLKFHFQMDKRLFKIYKCC